MEINIFFKNVGQGDTLLLTWRDTETDPFKYGMIDCNTYNGQITCITDHIESEGITRFEFVILSHPHSDHFSGFMKFMEYCEKRKIIIKKFIHTATFQPGFLNGLHGKNYGNGDIREIVSFAVNYKRRQTDLIRLYEYIHKQAIRKDSFIHGVHVINNDYEMKITNEVSMRFLSPYMYDEISYYLERFYERGPNDKKITLTFSENNPQANYFSSFIQLFNDKQQWQVLLCSDITKYTLEKILHHRPHVLENLTGYQLLAAQIPHHGSKFNHLADFWENIPGLDNAEIIISVGDGYGHPNYGVIDFFKARCKSVHATNFVGGYRDSYQNESLHKTHLFQKKLDSLNVGCISTSPFCCEKELKISTENGLPSWYIKDHR